MPSNSFEPSKPVYENVEQHPQSKPNVLYANIDPRLASDRTNTRYNDLAAVNYAEMQHKEDTDGHADGHTAAPSAVIYAQVQKRWPSAYLRFI